MLALGALSTVKPSLSFNPLRDTMCESVVTVFTPSTSVSLKYLSPHEAKTTNGTDRTGAAPKNR
nr:hypothetical protein [Mycoplasmopsis bovis]